MLHNLGHSMLFLVPIPLHNFPFSLHLALLHTTSPAHCSKWHQCWGYGRFPLSFHHPIQPICHLKMNKVVMKLPEHVLKDLILIAQIFLCLPLAISVREVILLLNSVINESCSSELLTTVIFPFNVVHSNL